VVEPRLVALFRRSFPTAGVIASDQVNAADARAALLAADYHVAAGSLPRHLRRRIDDFTSDPGYLRADPAQVALFRQRLGAAAPGPRIGLCWRSRVAGGRRNRFYLTVGELAPVLRLPATFVNLQYDEATEELNEARRLTDRPVIALDGVDLMRDLDGAAALTAALDLVVTVATSVNDMAGALGVPTVLLTHEDNWAMHGTSGIPWYPAARVALRRHGEGWAPAVERAVALIRDTPMFGG
jgi:hypothetical protein